ncbi:MAG: peptidylprolyl isomerase [Candidatus Margulisbacteria bacterium]|jgi:foldase protein PrsA|nr:peptidylprolyl isomerase [Candidatus Margulisiibacteriota bacterium]
MLNFMRKYADKIIWILVIAFVLSIGVVSCTGRRRGASADTPQRSRNANTLATINGQDIDARLFLRIYNGSIAGFRSAGQSDMIDPRIDAYVGYAALMQTLDAGKRLDYAKRLKIKVGRGEINQQVEALKNAYQLQNNDDFNKLLEANGLKLKDLKQDIRQQLMLARIDDSIKRSVVVSDRDVQNQYKRVRARHILISFNRSGWTDQTDAEREKLARDLAAGVYDQLMAGQDFAELAREYSDDAGSAVRGGELGWFGVNTMVPEFEDVAFNLEKDQISKPFQTQFGYHIVQTEEIDQQEIPLDVDEKELQQQLLTQRQQLALQRFYNKLQTEYKTEIFYPPFQAYDLKMQGELDKALNLYRQIGAQNPQSPVAYLFTAEIYELQQKYAEAQAEYDRAFLIQKLNPGWKIPYLHFYQAGLYAKQNKNAQAVKELQLAEALVSDNVQILERIKDQYTELKSSANANKVDLKIKALQRSRIVPTADETVEFD